jgi:CBS domain-containing protein
MQVGELMTELVHACGPKQTLRAAARIMWDHDCGCVPIIDSDYRLIGIITDRDIAVTAHLRGLPLEDIVIGDVMETCVFSCKANDSVTRAMELMQQLQVHRLPVTDQLGFLVGLITLNDLALEAERGDADGSVVSRHDVGRTLAKIGAHRPPTWGGIPGRTHRMSHALDAVPSVANSAVEKSNYSGLATVKMREKRSRRRALASLESY